MNAELDAYIAGTADESQQARIEEALISDPALAAQLDVRQRIKGGLQLLEERGQLAPLLEAEVARTHHARWALAASVLVVLMGLAWVYRSPQMDSSQPESQALLLAATLGARSVDRSVIVAHTRGGAPQPIAIGPGDAVILLRLMLEESPPGPLQVSLSSEGNADTGGLVLPPAEDGYAEVYLDTRHVKPGKQSLVVSSAGVPVESFELLIERR